MFKHFGNRLITVNAFKFALLCIILNKRSSLFSVNGKPFFNGFGIIVFSDNEFFATVRASFPIPYKVDMKRAVAFWAISSAYDAVFYLFKIYVNVYYNVRTVKRVKGFCLLDIARPWQSSG